MMPDCKLLCHYVDTLHNDLCLEEIVAIFNIPYIRKYVFHCSIQLFRLLLLHCLFVACGHFFQFICYSVISYVFRMFITLGLNRFCVGKSKFQIKMIDILQSKTLQVFFSTLDFMDFHYTVRQKSLWYLHTPK